MKKKTILIAGGSGMIGSALVQSLGSAYNISILTRKKASIDNTHSFYWNPDNSEIDDNAILNADIIINLTGENIGAKRWTTLRKKVLIDSRMKATKLLLDSISRIKKPELYISASAIGYYGHKGDRKLYETDLPDDSFLSQVCKQWEKPLENIDSFRKIIIRIGIVLASQGGMLKEILTPTKWGINVYFGSGKQYISWIHIQDLCSLIQYSIENPHVSGVYNAVAPNTVNALDFATTLQKSLERKLFTIRIPTFVTQIILGKQSELMLSSQNVSCVKIQKAGFRFEYSQIDKALENLL